MSLEIIPNDLSDLTSGENKIAKKISSLYSTIERNSFLYIKPRLKNLEPDFILIDTHKGVCIIEVKDWDIDYIQSINRIEIITTNGKKHPNPIFKTNKYYNFAKNLFEFDNNLINEDGDFKFNLYSKVAFVNIKSSEIENLNGENILYQPPTDYLISEDIRILNIDKLFSSETCYIDSLQTKIIRSILFPENIIQNCKIDSKTDSVELIDNIKVLDINQEKFAKRIPYGHYMISGVPGSGKTVILFSRAIFLLKKNPDWNIKIVTYNKSLSKKLNVNLNKMRGDLTFMNLKYENISVSTFHALALEIANINKPHNPSDDFWDNELPLKAMEKARPKYDAILIDEYQDFDDVWIELCLALCKKHSYNGRISENLFLAGDRLQSIYNPKEHTWKSLGVNIQGRSKLLKHSYRSGKSHIELALDFLMSDRTLKKEVEKFYEGREGIDNENGLDNEIEFLDGRYDKINTLLHKLISEFGYKPEEILVLIPTKNNANKLFNQFDDFLKSNSIVMKIVDNKIIITTYHSSKGLESKVCILVNVDKIDINKIINKKLLYVGITRASERLYIHAFDFEKESFARQLKYKEFEETQGKDKINHSLTDYLSSFIRTNK